MKTLVREAVALAAVAGRRSAPYAGRKAVLATMHGKQEAIVPILRDQLGLIVSSAPDIDTDAPGTFTGEIPRAGTSREAAIAKARLGMAATGLPIGLASEGSYGPHPQIPFVPGGVELMVERAVTSAKAQSRDCRALIQTDMRAHMNPTRMATLGRLASALAERLSTLCPACGMPVYGQVEQHG